MSGRKLTKRAARNLRFQGGKMIDPAMFLLVACILGALVVTLGSSKRGK
jgi:hypothetical protein